MQGPLQWLSLFNDPIDIAGFLLFLIVFPIYHAVYPWLTRWAPGHAAKPRVDRLRRSWIERLINSGDMTTAAQQTRNLTMVNSLLASSALILMGVTANVLMRSPNFSEALTDTDNPWSSHPDAQGAKLFLLIVVFAIAFAYSTTALRHLGHFVLVVGADPKLIEEVEGDPVEYLSGLINRASNRYTLAVRCLYSASPLFVWLFDSGFFLILTIFWAIKFVGFQDFVRSKG